MFFTFYLFLGFTFEWEFINFSFHLKLQIAFIIVKSFLINFLLTIYNPETFFYFPWLSLD